MKTLTKVTVTYHPPTFKFEYTKGKATSKYHKKVDLVNFYLSSIQLKPSSTVKLSQELTHALVERYDELHQISLSNIDILIQKLISANPSSFSTNHSAHQKSQTRTNDGTVDGPKQINTSINNGSLIVSPIQERPPLQRHTVVQETTSIKSSPEDNNNNNNNKEEHLERHSPKELDILSEFGNLNQASDVDLRAAKDGMSKVFEKYQILPGDVEYVYDKRIDFEDPDEESSWD